MVDLSIVDLSGSIVGLIYNGKRRYKSTIGGFFTILMGIGIIIIAIVYMKDYFERTKPKMSFETLKYYNPPSQDISTHFNFTVIMQYGGQTTIRNDIIKVNASYISKNGTTMDTLPLSNIPCIPESNDNDNLFEKLELSKGLCYNTTSLTLTGTKVNDLFQYIQIKFLLCMNETECLPLNQMEQFFEDNKPIAFVYFKDTIFQTNDKSKRITTFYNYVDVNVTYKNAKENNIYFSKNELLVDDSYLFATQPKNYSAFVIESFRDLVSVRTEKQKDALTLNLLASKKKEVIHLSYMQLSELLANISALVNILMVFFNSIGDHFNHHLFQSDLMQALYHISPDQVETKKLPIKKDLSLKLNTSNRASEHTTNKSIFISNKELHLSKFAKPSSPSNTNFQIFKNIINHSDCKLPIFKKNKTMIIEKKEINKLVLSNILPIFCSKDFKTTKKMYEKISSSMTVYQDQINIFRKLQEVDFMKYLLLTEDQLSLYQIVPKPDFLKYSAYNNKEFASFFSKPSFHYLKNVKDIENEINGKDVQNSFIKPNLNNNFNDINGKLMISLNKY